MYHIMICDDDRIFVTNEEKDKPYIKRDGS